MKKIAVSNSFLTYQSVISTKVPKFECSKNADFNENFREESQKN